ncbi:MAG TPA: ABC transporter permease subunit [Streptosporangiaceae bacterium]|nr:ABC transporter permease subunit [Streptosporangiaceae bacterium]
MADSVTTAVAPEVTSSGARPRRGPKAIRTALRWAGIVPFTVYVAAGLLAPMVAIAIFSFQPNHGGFVASKATAPTLTNLDTAVHGIYLTGLTNVLLLSLATSVAGGVFGFLIAYAIHTARRGTVLRRVVITAAGVFANFGGVPLAFLFIATLSTTGVVTGWINDLFNFQIWNHGFSLFKPYGVAIVYLYFQTPLMVLVILPALEGLRPAWREAAQNLGAGAWRYWRHVGGPVLLPSFLGCLLLLFGGGMSAYATAEALTGGTIALTPIQIGSLLNGNVLAGQENLGYALGLILVAIIAVVMVGYSLLQRRAAKWLR